MSGDRGLVPPPTVSGPVAGGRHGWPFAASLDDLSRFGYVEEEYIVEGDAVCYRPVAELGFDGRWVVEPAGTDRFRTRVLVQRPRDPDRANGTVVVGWNNVTAGYELLAELPAIAEEGFVYACASVQYVGIEGVGNVRQGLKSWDPERYGSLVHPGDRYSYGIFSQVAAAVGPRRSGAVDPLGGIPVNRVVALGASQSASRLLTYVNAVQPHTAAFDGFCVLIHFGSGAAIDDDAVFDPLGPRTDPVFRTRARFRGDLGIPIMVVNSETETRAYAGARQEDTDLFRFWEVAGAAHVSAQQYERRSRKAARDGLAERERPQSASHISYVPAAGAALVHLQRWMAGGPPPPRQPPIALSAGAPPAGASPAGPIAIDRDEHGNAVGGVRMPGVEVPIGRDSGIGPVEGLAGLGGIHEPFPQAKLRSLYGDRAGYMSRFAAAAARAVEAGVLRPSEAEQLEEEARAFDGFT